MKKTLHIIPHSHWDREWYMPLERHKMKLLELIDANLEQFEKDPEFQSFHLDGQTIVLDEAKPAEKVKLTILEADGGTLNWVNVGVVEVELYGDTHTEAPAANPNLALNRPATCSNVEGGTSFTADKAVDGSTATGSRWATDQHVVDPWIEIDLDDGSVLKQFNIMFERADANQNILDFKIEAEINGVYETIYDYEGGRPAQRLKIVLDEAVTADKMKLTVTNYDSGTSGWASVSIFEIEAYSYESMSLADVAAGLNALAGTVITGEKLELPAVPDGITVELNGADLQQIIAKDGSVHKPLNDKTVNVSFVVSDGEKTELTGDIPVVVKGLRAVSDFESEVQMAIINSKINPDLDTIFFPSSEKYTYLSSSVAKEMARYNADLSEFLPREILEDVKKKLTEK